ncbi:DUF433 domain-containing protein [Candidatus Palauibacter sp.]
MRTKAFPKQSQYRYLGTCGDSAEATTLAGGVAAETGTPMDRLNKPMNWRDHITVDPEICHGRACITGTRVLVTTVLDNLAAGLDSQAIVESYPSVTPEAVRAAICYAAELAKERVLSFSG